MVVWSRLTEERMIKTTSVLEHAPPNCSGGKGSMTCQSCVFASLLILPGGFGSLPGLEVR